MTEEKVYKPEVIEENPFPHSEVGDFHTSQSTTNETYSPQKIKQQPLPSKKIAHETIGSALNTKAKKILGAFEFIQQGAIQIGKYLQGISGDIRLTPNGITARNKSGNTTFNLDGETGDATFAGTIQTGAVIAGKVVVGNNTWVIDGDPDNPQIILYNDGIPEIVIGSV